ncbi:4'-phosphopantetheinyl transferase EntD [Bradyrhizobium sp. USDA 4524]|uniref:4'-phosphopantetheinyl transferase family protein n=1 Tax=unclassified Bradyrhizobium TaxID=2631580 RepID=UPI0020A1B01F|nr:MULTISPECIES: 4'-phosphopantetheinyl transferase superfamily protein [unclassified Bradyrhizobium]MCP1845863.1 4'-phosphopantetheinyl transferase EntD [Bradyrhizobium sp. USDA 4538]MCP1907503.1 4'-phosphopantetheinyl transferase EntD [Bradyrhizobium sp. USDA 4537]MCP1985289.1 4'-phosphopantetheinyl transferase EntD [Bradyrhizobium sp. USDA 4539]
MIPIDLSVLDGNSPVEFKVGDRIFGVVGKIGNYTEQLYPEELVHVKRAVKKRRDEHSSGRYFARLALDKLGCPSVAILMGSSRQPIWPDGIIGSIAHSDEFALAVVAIKGETYDAIGVDLECIWASPDLVHLVLTAQELRRLDVGSSGAARLATLIFSAKESVFKAVNPLVNLMIDFDEIEIHLDRESQMFRAVYIGPNRRNAIINNGVGSYTVFEHHVLCMFLLARGALNSTIDSGDELTVERCAVRRLTSR